jgi:type IV pilus assembly protein PilB
MTAVIAQRLVRRLCHQSKQSRPATSEEQETLNISEDVQLYEPVGCAVCQGTGYKGRLGLFETLWFNEKLARMVARGADEEELEAAAGNDLQFMWEDGCKKVLAGLTTLSEVRDVAVQKTHDTERTV